MGTDPRRYLVASPSYFLTPQVIWFSFLLKREKCNYFFVVRKFPALHIKISSLDFIKMYSLPLFSNYSDLPHSRPIGWVDILVVLPLGYMYIRCPPTFGLVFMYNLSCYPLTCCEPVRLARTCDTWLPVLPVSAKFRLMESESCARSMCHFPFLPFPFAFGRLHGERVIDPSDSGMRSLSARGKGSTPTIPIV